MFARTAERTELGTVVLGVQKTEHENEQQQRAPSASVHAQFERRWRCRVGLKAFVPELDLFADGERLAWGLARSCRLCLLRALA